MTDIKQIKKDLKGYKAAVKRQGGVTLYAEKYVEDIEHLLGLLAKAESAKEGSVVTSAEPKSKPSKSKK